jgi:hypothetical protein
MSSEAAKARAVRRGPGAWGFLLAHHWPDQLDRCYQAWIGKLLFVLPAPALVDWALGRLGIRPGSNRGRTFWGMFLGASLGRMIYLNMIDPANTLVVIQIAALVGVLVLVESARPFVIRRREAGP